MANSGLMHDNVEGADVGRPRHRVRVLASVKHAVAAHTLSLHPPVVVIVVTLTGHGFLARFRSVISACSSVMLFCKVRLESCDEVIGATVSALVIAKHGG